MVLLPADRARRAIGPTDHERHIRLRHGETLGDLPLLAVRQEVLATDCRKGHDARDVEEKVYKDFSVPQSYLSAPKLSIGKFADVLSPSKEWRDTFRGRLNQARRELAVVLGRDVLEIDLARMAGLDQSSFSYWWKNDSLPSRDTLDLFEALFTEAGLWQYSAVFLERGIRTPKPPRAPYPPTAPGTPLRHSK